MNIPNIPFQMYTSVSLNHNELYENLVTRFASDPYMDIAEITPEYVSNLLEFSDDFFIFQQMNYDEQLQFCSDIKNDVGLISIINK
jgi:hypothetical protein